MKMFYELSAVSGNESEIIDRMQIRELVEYDRYCVDYGLKDEEKRLWFEDGKIVTTWFDGSIKDYLGNEKIMPKENKKGEPIESYNHRINNTVVWLRGDKAIAEVLCFLNFRSLILGAWMDLQCWCRFHYRVEKRNGQWGIVYFEGIYEKDRMDPVFQDCKVQIPEKALRSYRPINWNMMLREQLLGKPKNADRWVGSDKPETLRKLYEESSEWLGLVERREEENDRI